VKKEVALDVAGALRSGISSLMKGGGSFLGGMVGAPAAGGAAGAWLSKATGFGDYTVSGNSLLTAGVPTFTKNARRITVAHREFIQDLTGSTSFAISAFACNPGNPVAFPWLSSVAQNFQQYRFKGLIFEYQSASADALNSTNTALGTVVMATNYNAARANFSSKIEMESSEFSCRTKPSDSLMHPIECAMNESPLEHLYIRTGPVPSGQDQRLYDFANFQLATQGMQAAATIGELWVTYEVELLKPRLAASAGYSAPIEWAWRQATTYSNSDPFNTGGLIITCNGGLGVTVSNLVITFPAAIASGTYLISIAIQGSGGVTIACSAPVVSSNGALNTSYFGTGGYLNSNGSTNATNFALMIAVNINTYSSSGTTVTLSGFTLPTSPVFSDLMVMPAPLTPNSSPY